MLPTAVQTLISFIIFAFITYYLRIRYYSNGRDKTLWYFTNYFLFMTIFMAIFTLPQIFMPQNSKAIALGYIFGHRIFLVLAQAYIFAVFLRLWNKEKWLKPAFVAIFIVGAIILGLNIVRMSNPITLPSGVIDWNQDPLTGQLTGIFSMLIGLPPLIFFLVRIIKATENHIRLRASLITIGLLMSAIFGPFHDMVTTIPMYRLAGTGTILGLIIILGGIIYKIPVEAGKFSFSKPGQLAVKQASSAVPML